MYAAVFFLKSCLGSFDKGRRITSETAVEQFGMVSRKGTTDATGPPQRNEKHH